MKVLDAQFVSAWSRHITVPSWQWAADEIDYSRAINYDTPYRGPFDPELMPFWKLPLELARHRDVREIVVLKPKRIGYSENYLLVDLRYTIAREPEPTLYVSGSMDLTTGFLDRRVIRGMSLSRETKAAFSKARAVKQDVQFQTMDFRATWASSDTATKQDGWARIHCDEVSLWKEFTVDMVRGRADAYPHHHIIYGGSIDPTRKGNPDEDPILKLYAESDRRVWMMTDPAGGSFLFTLDGLKWPLEAKTDDGWDLNQVEAEAWYETPGGERVEEKHRLELVRDGYWEVTRPGGIRPGFKITAPMGPFQANAFGVLAKRFLSARYRMNLTGKRDDRTHNTLRVYFAENWAEAHREEESMAHDTDLTCCEADYEIGNVWMPKAKMDSGVFVTVDVQKLHLWWVARTWAYDKESERAVSSLLDCGNSPSFHDLDSTIGEFSPAMVGIDIGYALRQSEVADYCAEYADASVKDSRVMALRGSEKMLKNVIEWIARDATEGRTQTGFAPFLELMWAADVFRSWLIDCLNGNDWWSIPRVWPDARKRVTYNRQVTSTSKLDGEWVAKHRDDHMFDMEVMQLVLARWDGMI